MIIWEGIQGTPEWFEQHRGVPTASNFDRIITPTGKPSAQAQGLIFELIAQRCTVGSIQPDGYISRPMLNGLAMEGEARRYYEFERNVEVRQVGMVFSDDRRFACSPDFLAGEDGVGELKCPLLHTHLKYLFEGVLPPIYAPQCHGALIVTRRPWLDFMSYPTNAIGIDPFLIRVYPDSFTAALEKCLELFDVEYKAALAKIRLPAKEAP